MSSCNKDENKAESKGATSASADAASEAPTHRKSDENENDYDEEDAVPANCLARSLAPSELATLRHVIHVPKYLSWFEYPFRIKSVSTGRILPEATGWGMDAAARGPLNLVGTYVGVALIRIASVDAGCTQLQNCDNTIYGLKPSSMLTAATAIVGVAAALLMPIVGAIVDHTPHRRIIGQISAIILVTITAIQMSLNESNWFPILCLEAIGGFTLLVHVAAVFSYLPDLSIHVKDYIHYTSSFNLRQFTSQTLFAAFVTVISYFTQVKGDPVGNSIRTSRAASAITFGFSFLLLGYAWSFSFRKRPAIRRLRNNESLWTVGFSSVYRTSKEVFSELQALKWLMIALLWSPESGAGVISSIAVTFLQVAVKMTAFQISITLLILLASHLPGTIISRFVCNKYNPLVSYRMAMVAFAVASSLAAWLINTPLVAYIFACLWGMCLGWIYPSQKVLFCTLIPKGQEFEFMGLFTFFGHILGWLPTILFTVMNERGVNIRWGFAVLPIFYILAFLCTCFMGDYNEAVELVGKGGFALDSAFASSTNMDTHVAGFEDSNTTDSRRFGGSNRSRAGLGFATPSVPAPILEEGSSASGSEQGDVEPPVFKIVKKGEFDDL